jgi:hypothetical protein
LESEFRIKKITGLFRRRAVKLETADGRYWVILGFERDGNSGFKFCEVTVLERTK